MLKNSDKPLHTLSPQHSLACTWYPSLSLADMLKKKGLAKDYDGEGARPEWWELKENFSFPHIATAIGTLFVNFIIPEIIPPFSCGITEDKLNLLRFHMTTILVFGIRLFCSIPVILNQNSLLNRWSKQIIFAYYRARTSMEAGDNLPLKGFI